MKRFPAVMYVLCALLWAYSAAISGPGVGRALYALSAVLYVASAVMEWRTAK